MENQPLSESKSDSAGQSEIDLRGESVSHLQDESASESQNDSWNDSPDADTSTGLISVRRSVSGSGSNTGRSGDNSKTGRGDAGSGVITAVSSDAESDEQSINRSFRASGEGSNARSF